MILITGAAGFIGSAYASYLNKKGLYNLILSDAFGSGNKWKNILGTRFVEFVDRYTLFDFLEKNPLAQKITAVVHLGACTNTTEENMDFLLDTNVQYTTRLCKWAMERKIRFVYASSGAVYGDGALGFSDADALTPQLRPLNAYGFSKWLFDMWILENGLIDSVAGLRFFNVFGPNEYHKGAMASVIFRSLKKAKREGVVRLFESHRGDYGHGEQKRDFIYVDEVLDAVYFVMEHKNANGIFNVGTGKAHTFNELAEALLTGLKKPINIEYFPMPEDIRSRYQYFTEADMSRLQNAGYTLPGDTFAQNVQKYVRKYLIPAKYHSQV
ncbi:ADP-glyceromanno-heptose 6-epimerase [bacterium]|nr:ADP-glyceromanno-heptose 6-epimerase [bacterium]